MKKKRVIKAYAVMGDTTNSNWFGDESGIVFKVRSGKFEIYRTQKDALRERPEEEFKTIVPITITLGRER